MNKAISFGAVMLPFALSLAACSDGPSSSDAVMPKHPAYLYIVDDVSSSARVQADDPFGKGVRARAAEAVKQLEKGDRVQLVEAGSLEVDRLVAHPLIRTGHKVRLAKASRMLAGQLEDVARRTRASGGDASTNLMAALANLRPDCASDRSVIMIVSDGVESSAAFDAEKALASGKPVALPPPAAPFLRGCRVEFIGFGVLSNGSGAGGQLLPARELEALRKGWSEYLTAAGASEVTFTSMI